MTVTITQHIRDVTGVSDNTRWRFSSVLREGSDDASIVTTRSRTIKPVNGILTIELDPGPAMVTFNDQTFSFTVPDTDSDLWSLIEAGVAVPPNTPAQQLAAAVDAYLSAHPPAAALPAQTGHAGEFLTTDGTDPSWALQRVTITDEDKEDIVADVGEELEPPVSLTILLANALT